MRLKSTLLALALLAFSTSFTFAGNQSANINGFDFNYSVDLNKSIGLTQVFDDGDRTYFQFTEAENLPTIFAMKDGKRQPVSLEVRPPYLIAEGVAGKYVLSVNNGKTSIYVSYNGSRVAEVVAQKIAEHPKVEQEKTAVQKTIIAKDDVEIVDVQRKKHLKNIKPENLKAKEESRESANNADSKLQGLTAASLFNIPFFENSIALSKKTKEDLSKRIDEIRAANKIVVRGRPSVKNDITIASTRALAIKNYLVDLGINDSVIETTYEYSIKQGKNQGFYLSELILLSSAQKALSKNKSWELSSADNNLEAQSVIPAKNEVAKRVRTLAENKTISRELDRLAAEDGWKLVWNLKTDWVVPATATYEGDFKSVATEVIKTLSQNGILIRAQFYDGNKTAVVFGVVQ